MDDQALIAAVFGTAIGAGACYLFLRRDWLATGGLLAIGAASVLGVITEGNRSHAEHTVVFVVTMGLIVCYGVSVGVRQRRVHKRPSSRK